MGVSSKKGPRQPSANRIRLVWLVHYPIFGGPSNRILRLAPVLRESGINVTALLPDDAGNAVARLRDGGIPVISIPIGRARASRDLHLQAQFVRNFRRDVRSIRAVLRAEQADALIVGGLINIQGPVAARLERVPLVWQILDSRTPRLFATALMPVVERLADVATFAGPALMHLHPGADRLKIPTMIVPPGVDVQKFRPSAENRMAIRQMLGIPDDAPVVGMVGNVNPQKGTEYFVRAAVRVRVSIPDVYFVIVGMHGWTHAAHRSKLEREIAASGLTPDRLLFVGDQKDVHRWYPAMDVMLMTSVPRSEGTPTVILEAWACGVPVVATDVGAVDSLVTDGEAGFIVPPCDAAAISDRAVRLASDRHLRVELGAAGRRIVEERYATNLIAEAHLRSVHVAMARAS